MNSEFTVAVHCLLVLASVPDRLCSSECLSRRVHTHPARVRKIMGALRRHGLVETKEGLGGGYRLNRHPADVSLARVYKIAACGALKLNWCVCGEKDDPAMDEIRNVLDQTFDQAEALLLDYLNQLTIESLLKRAGRVAQKPMPSEAALTAEVSETGRVADHDFRD